MEVRESEIWGRERDADRLAGSQVISKTLSVRTALQLSVDTHAYIHHPAYLK